MMRAAGVVLLGLFLGSVAITAQTAAADPMRESVESRGGNRDVNNQLDELERSLTLPIKQ